MNHVFAEIEYIKCFEEKYSQLCELAKDKDKNKKLSIVEKLDLDSQIKFNISIYCKEKNQILKYPRFK